MRQPVFSARLTSGFGQCRLSISPNQEDEAKRTPPPPPMRQLPDHDLLERLEASSLCSAR